MSLKDFTRPTNAVKNFSEPLPKSNYEIHTPNAPLSPKKRTIREVAKEIVEDWILTGKSFPHAAPYLEAMLCVEKPTDLYGAEEARGIVQYFLSNVESWRGEVARKIKAELREIVK
jgi:hypothetical protein